jgi:hypothetical protein
VRSSLSDSEMLDKIRETIAQLDPELPLFSLGALAGCGKTRWIG